MFFCHQVKRDPLETECTEDRSSVALCNLVSQIIIQKRPYVPKQAKLSSVALRNPVIQIW